jgi:hypothetical protein
MNYRNTMHLHINNTDKRCTYYHTFTDSTTK